MQQPVQLHAAGRAGACRQAAAARGLVAAGHTSPSVAAPAAKRSSAAAPRVQRAVAVHAAAQDQATAPVSPHQGEVSAAQAGAGTAAAPTRSRTSAAVSPISAHLVSRWPQPEWFALVANAEFYFNDVQNEALAEQLRELKRYYEEIGRELDFFFVSEPEWLQKFPDDAKRVKRPCVALVSTDKTWIT
jgi:hypothetical protein